MTTAAEVLVALASTETNISCRSANRRDDEQRTLSPCRPYTVLDSLASICVRRGKGEAYAIAIQLEDKRKLEGSVTLTIAGNCGVPKEVLDHLEAVWSLVQKIAKLCHKHRRDEGNGYAIDFNKESHDSTETVAEDVIVQSVSELNRIIYTHCFEKLDSRVRKHFNRFRNVIAKVNTFVEAAPTSTKEERSALTTLWDAYCCIAAIYFEILNSSSVNIDFSKLVKYLNFLTSVVHDILEMDEDIIFEWLVEVNEPNFPLLRYLEKIVAIHSHCILLTKYARSPRLHRRFYGKRFKIVTVPPPQATPISIPQQWKMVLDETLLERNDTFITHHGSKILDDAWSKIQDKHGVSVTGVVHCECTLIGYLKKDPSLPQIDPAPLNYLGMSKLSCRACSKYIQAFNAHSGREFYIRGSHNKWYFPWALPQSTSDDVAMAFRDSMATYILDSFLDERSTRWRFDSDCSTPFGGLLPEVPLDGGQYESLAYLRSNHPVLSVPNWLMKEVIHRSLSE